VNFGPGDPLLAHADDERIPIVEIDRYEHRLRAWLTGS
jgi:succinyl-diaminopimelate desuccinylase